MGLIAFLLNFGHLKTATRGNGSQGLGPIASDPKQKLLRSREGRGGLIALSIVFLIFEVRRRWIDCIFDSFFDLRGPEKVGLIAFSINF